MTCRDERTGPESVFALLRNHSAGNGRGKMESKFSSLALKVTNCWFFEKAFIGLLSGFNISLAEFEHAIQEPSKFVGSGVDRRRGSKAKLDASDECSDGSLALHGALSG